MNWLDSSVAYYHGQSRCCIHHPMARIQYFIHHPTAKSHGQRCCFVHVQMARNYGRHRCFLHVSKAQIHRKRRFLVHIPMEQSHGQRRFVYSLFYTSRNVVSYICSRQVSNSLLFLIEFLGILNKYPRSCLLTLVLLSI